MEHLAKTGHPTLDPLVATQPSRGKKQHSQGVVISLKESFREGTTYRTMVNLLDLFGLYG